MKKYSYTIGALLAVGVIALGLFLSCGQDYDKRLNQKVYSDLVLEKTYAIVCYEKGCPFCENSKSEVLKEAKKSDLTTVYVDVESKEGQKIVKKYQVERSASLILVKANLPRVYVYGKEDKDGKIVPDKEVIKAVFRQGGD